MELDGLPPRFLESLWTTLREPTSVDQFRDLMAAYGEGASDLLEIFETEGVLHPCRMPADTPPAIVGDGVLRVVLADLMAYGGWHVPTLHCVSFDRPPTDSDHALAGNSVVLGALSDSVVVGGLGCSTCWKLRTLGAVGVLGEQQTTVGLRSDLDPDELVALVAAALLALESTKLAPFEGLWIRHEQGLARGRVLRHPDCPRCSKMVLPESGVERLRQDLHIDRAASVRAGRIRAVFGESPFAPLRLTEVPDTEGNLPLGVPFLSGDTRLSRCQGDRIQCASIPGIFHASATTAERSRMIAWSEGVERLAAQSAGVDLWLQDSDARVTETRLRYGWRRTELSASAHAFCRGLDLLRSLECLVPFGRVAAGIPTTISPGQAAVEPTFTGVASHVTSLQAILHGTVEAMTRDAFMIAWYRKRCLDRIIMPNRLPADMAKRVAYLRGQGLRFDLFDLRADLPLPIVLMDVRAERRVGQWPAGGAVLIPAGGFTPTESLRHALVLACARFAGIGLDTSPEKNPLDPFAVDRLGRTAPFWPPIARYLDPAATGAIDFLRGSRACPLHALKTAVPRTTRGRFEVLRDWLTAAGLNWIAVPLVDDYVLEAGLRVTRVVVPEAIRMTLRSDEVDREQPRFWRSWSGASDGSWNSEPHPVC